MISRKSLINEHGELIKVQEYEFKLFDDDKGYKYRVNNSFVKQYQDIKLSDVVKNDNDYCTLHRLAESLYKDTNMISIRKSKRYRPATIEDMQAITNKAERYIREFLQRMQNLGVIAKVIVNSKERVEVQYYINPLYFMTSKYLTNSLYMLFRKQLDAHLPHWVIAKFHQ